MLVGGQCLAGIGFPSLFTDSEDTEYFCVNENGTCQIDETKHFNPSILASMQANENENF